MSFRSPCVSRDAILVVAFAWMFVSVAPAASAAGRIEGRLTRPNGAPIPGVLVSVNDGRAVAVSAADGRYSMSLPPATYSLQFLLGDFSGVADGVVVTEGGVARVDREFDWALRYTDTVIVESASRHTDRLVDAPASVTVIDSAQIGALGTQGQLPRLLESAPGIEATRSGVFDFNVNARGFNGFLNRRLLVLLDGRDPGGVFVGAQEWGAYSLVPENLARIEVIRGPGSALYGSNAFNGVVSFISKSSRDDQGGMARLAVGERATATIAASHAAALNERWSYRAAGQFGRTRDFYQSRVAAVEYPGLRTEVGAPRQRTEVTFGTFRLDAQWDGQRSLVVEGGDARLDGHVFVSPVGRSQNVDVQRPWARVRLGAGAWAVSGYWDARRGADLGLASGSFTHERSDKLHVETLRLLTLPRGKGTVVAGASLQFARIDSRDPAGVHTSFREVEDGTSGGVFGQGDVLIAPSLKAVLGLRVDGSTLHPSQASPKAGVVYSFASGQSLRVTYARAFQAPTFAELFTRVPVAPPVSLGAVEQALASFIGNVPLRLASVPIYVVGNEALRVERVQSVEAGYSGVLARRFVVSADYYRSALDDFISSVLPQLGTSLGRVNPVFGPYRPPAALSAAQQAVVLTTLEAVLPPASFALLSNQRDGSPAFIALSVANFGGAHTQGLDAGVQYFGPRGMSADASYSWFGFSVERDLPENPLTGNAAPHRLQGGITYTRPRYAAGLRVRWSHTFAWAQGQFAGDVPSYTVTDVTAQLQLTRALALRADVANAFDRRHFELFGGDLLRRRALADVVVNW